MAEKRRGLGRGLGALISSSPAAGPDEEESAPDVLSGTANEQKATTTDTKPKRPAAGGSKTSTNRGSAASASDTPATAQRAPEASAGGRQGTDSPKTSGAPQKAPDRPGGSATGNSRKPASKGTGSTTPRTKARPVDMFFTPGRSADDDGTAQSKVAAEPKAQVRNAKRPQMPDVIGQARTRSATSAPDVSDADPTGDGSPTPDADTSAPSLVPVPGATFAELSVKEIHPNRKQPRQVFDQEDMDELVHSIKEIGLLQPIVVRPSTEVGEGTYELVMGERRWRATQQAGLETIPAIVRKTTDEDLLRDALLENLHRSELNPLEEAAAYQQLLDEFGCTQEELSARIGRSRPQISNTIRLMKLPALVQRRVAAGVLSQGHARALLALSDPAEIERLAQRIVAEGLSVRATEEAVAMNEGVEKKRRETKPRSTARHERLDYLANSLSDRLDTSVKISLGAKKGRVAIEFASVDDLNRIMGLISPDGDK
nr:ParB/RepB/Spo0J family partition protein [Zhihengliuella salsuginis]